MMSEKRISLDVIGVAEPCHQDWSGMTGGEQKKFCDSCAKHVHNLSEMTRDDAEQFVSANPTGVCIRFRRDARTGKMLTLDDACEVTPAIARPPAAQGRGRFSGPGTRRKRSYHPGTPTTKRRAARRMAGHVFVPFLSVFSLIAGAVAVVFSGGRGPAGGSGCVMGMMAGPMPVHQPQYRAAGVGTAPVQLPPAGFLAQATPVAVPPAQEPEVHMGGIEGPPVLMGRIAAPPPPPPEPEPAEPQPAPEIMGAIEFIMGDIVCPEEPVVAVDPIPAPPAPAPPAQGTAAQN